MKVRIIEMFDPSKCENILLVQKWVEAQEYSSYFYTTTWRADGSTQLDTPKPYIHPAHWDGVKDFALNDFERATAYAKYLSGPPDENKIWGTFENGREVKDE